jgi:hypothetical protein
MPMRILLIGAVVFLAAWFTILKPGGGEEAVPPPVQPANVAPAATATPEAATDTTVAATAIPADVLRKLPKDVAKAVTAGKTLVLGVFADDAENWRPMADDDRYVRNALKKTNRYKGEVFAKNVSIADLSTYGPLVNELDVSQSPSVVVIDRNLKGTVLTGYVDRVAINQAIADARRDSIVPAITDEFLRDANQICSRFKLLYSRFSGPTIHGKKARNAALDRYVAIGRKYARAVDSTPAPAQWKGLKAQWEKTIVTDLGLAKIMVESVKTENLFGVLFASMGFDLTENAKDKLDRRFDAAGVTSCVSHRRS